ncbi:biotin carboxylase N-terminal domain-containing protein [Alphaproteobacteria bacterium]|nr:biotin carboxylase N-terminal domain-containing protein [Alphaproteobacteria bacterium]
MKKILIANRGEIACRIIKTCKLLGYKSVAVYSEVDRNSKHVRLADEAFFIGQSKAQESYLVHEKIIDAAKKTNSDAIHPGFGFLSENANFADKVIQNQITWIGPKPKIIKEMGNKTKALELAKKANVPVSPSINNPLSMDEEELKKQCEIIQYPILVKASAGGGGIGMSVAHNFSELKKTMEKTSNLADKAFGDGAIFLEKFITNARHVEIQIFGFGKQSAIHMHERDCSMQRRYQKIIEESPAPNIEFSIIESMTKAAVELSSKVNYEGAGTVEFIYDLNEKKFYFLEMNTRIQVEHPVTELITNCDLIAMQIQFAFDRKKKFLKQEDITSYGHAIECRVYAEDPAKNFLPSPGKISQLIIPDIPDGIRMDWGFNQGDEVSFYYDPMVGKIISHGVIREDAINKLITFLKKVKVVGIKTNIPFIISLLKNKTFKESGHNTKFIENNLDLLNNEMINKKQSEIMNHQNTIDISSIKIIKTDDLKVIKKIKTSRGSEDMKIVFFD